MKAILPGGGYIPPSALTFGPPVCGALLALGCQEFRLNRPEYVRSQKDRPWA